jgi:internalin A
MTTSEEYKGEQEALRRIREAEQDGATLLDLSDLELTTLPPEIGSLATLKALYLQRNELSALPSEIGSLTALHTLDLGDNQLSVFPAEIGSLTALQTLDLSDNQFSVFPAEINSLTVLLTLDLSGNELSVLPAEIGSLAALQAFYLQGNQLSVVPAEIGSLTALQALDLDGNQLSVLPVEVGSLAKLQTLDLRDNQLSVLPVEIGSLTALQTLYLQGNGLSVLPAEIGSLTTLQTLDLRDNELSVLPAKIGSLTALQTLDLRRNQLSVFPKEIGSLTALQTLYLQGNGLSVLPAEIGSLTALKELYLQENQLTSLPPELRLLPELRWLFLHGNPMLRLSPSILGPDPSKHGIDIEKVPSATSILDVYFGRLAGKTRPLNEFKLILVGRGGAGKTSVIRALRGLPFRKDETSTPGIALSDWELDCPDGTVTAHIWDFAGQVITHALHQFFFSVRSVYVLVLTGRENSEREDAEYWLRLIHAFGTEEGVGPPVIVALNKWDLKGCRPKVDRGALQERYPFIRGYVEIDCDTEKGVEKLREKIAREVARLKWVHEPFKAAWDEIRRTLAKGRGSAAYLPYGEFRKLCGRHSVTDSQEQDSLAEVLHNLGSALNYRNDPRLREATVLKPQWLTQNVYKLMRRAEKQAGVLKRADVDAALAKVPEAAMRDYLVRLMERFEIAYASRASGAASWLVPQALPDVQPKGAEQFAGMSDATRLRYSYQALPEGLVARAIVRLHEFIEEIRGRKQQWASGAILAREDARALLRTEPQDRRVMITVIGPADARRQLAGLCQAEMRDIHQEIKGLDPLEETEVDGSWVATATLEADELKHQQTGVPTRDRGTVSIDPVDANDAYTKQEARDDGRWKPTAFICYSKRNINQRKRLELELKVLRNEGLLAGHWHDRMIDPGDEWDPKIQRQLSDADIVIVLASSASLATDYITETEIPQAMALHTLGAVVVVPIVLEECRWDKTRLGELQALPEKGKAVDTWNPRSGAWKSIADGLAAVCKKREDPKRVWTKTK